jgi:hypothetical protein
MALTFPSTPNVNDIYQPSGSAASYRWTGTYWQIRQSANPLFGANQSGSLLQIDAAGYPVASPIVVINGQMSVTASSATSASFASSASLATTSSYSLTASLALTASSVQTLRQQVTISGSLIMGNETNTTTGTNTTTIGVTNSTAGNYSYARGDSNTVSGSFSTAIGAGHTISASNALAIGSGNIIYADSAMAFGGLNTALGNRSVVGGLLNKSLSNDQFIVGAYGLAVSSSTAAFIVGGGPFSQQPRNLIHAELDTVRITGSLELSGSIRIATGSITASLFGTASALSTNVVPYYIQAGNATGQTIPSQQVTTVTGWTTSVQSTGSSWNPTTGIFTCPRAGWYRLRGALTYTNNTASINREFNTIISVNDGNTYTGWTFRQTATSAITMTTPVEAIHLLAVGDTVRIKTYQDSLGNVALSNRADINLLTIQELPNFITK